MADDALLLPWLDDHAKAAGLVVGSINAGLANRVRRGDFESDERVTA